jgi:hypothetical protein
MLSLNNQLFKYIVVSSIESFKSEIKFFFEFLAKNINEDVTLLYDLCAFLSTSEETFDVYSKLVTILKTNFTSSSHFARVAKILADQPKQIISNGKDLVSNNLNVLNTEANLKNEALIDSKQEKNYTSLYIFIMISVVILPILVSFIILKCFQRLQKNSALSNQIKNS